MKSRLTKQVGFLLALIMIGCTTAMAQPEDNGGDPPNNDAPLDGGVSVLIAAGVGYGLKKMRDARNVKKDDLK